jgi:hypothetical protein
VAKGQDGRPLLVGLVLGPAELAALQHEPEAEQGEQDQEAGPDAGAPAPDHPLLDQLPGRQVDAGRAAGALPPRGSPGHLGHRPHGQADRHGDGRLEGGQLLGVQPEPPDPHPGQGAAALDGDAGDAWSRSTSGPSSEPPPDTTTRVSGTASCWER